MFYLGCVNLYGTSCVQLSTIFFVKGHHVVNGGQYVNQMARSVDYSPRLVNTALESTETYGQPNDLKESTVSWGPQSD